MCETLYKDNRVIVIMIRMEGYETKELQREWKKKCTSINIIVLGSSSSSSMQMITATLLLNSVTMP